MKELVFIKLGGSSQTRQNHAPLLDVMDQIALQIATTLRPARSAA
jgi:hypothetical protein